MDDLLTNIGAGGVTDARRDNHPEGGGSIPASALFFQQGRTEEVKYLVKRYHYSKRWPGNVQFVGSLHEKGGLFGDSGPVLCGLTFSLPPTRWSETVLELTRLVRRDDAEGIPLTLLIRLALSRLRQGGADLVVSFADRTQGHHGGIYQAAGWKYGGCRDRSVDGVLIDGQFWPGRSLNTRFGTRSPDKLQSMMPKCIIEPHYDEGKHLYWKALGRQGKAKATRLKLAKLPYPVPTRET